MSRLLSILLLLLIAAVALTERSILVAADSAPSSSSPSSSSTTTSFQDHDSSVQKTLSPLFFPSLDIEQDEEEAIILRELEWAETAMEDYKRKNGKVPIRSTIHAPHVHSAEWKKDSMNVVISGSSRLGSLRRRNNKDTTNVEEQR
jgi:hypothetical protein